MADSKTSRYIILLLPPGSAKSTYTSATFPPWYLGRCPGAAILACSYAHTLAEQFGRRGRNLVNVYHQVLGYRLRADSKSAGEWETSNGGLYFCAGVGAGIAGHRADLGLIDDPLGSQEDADSQLMRDKQWEWFLGDFYPRLKPNASVIVIANRRHEDDLIGRLLSNERNNPIPTERWEVIRLPFFAEENDLLGRAVGERLWPEWFTAEMADAVNKLPPRTRSGLYQQNPSPEEGDYFKREWLVGYCLEELPKELKVYAACDFAVSEERDANRTCFVPGGIDADGCLWILPDVWWKSAGPKEVLDNLVALIERREPIITWAEKGHISKSLGPFLKDQMLAEKVYGYIEEVTPARAKDVRARSIQGMMAVGRVRFPKFASWWPAAEDELLHFHGNGSKSDDLVDALAHLGMGVYSMIRGKRVKVAKPEFNVNAWQPTMRWIKDSDKRIKARSLPRYQGR